MKINQLIKKIFGFIVLFTLLLGGLSVFGYLFAMYIGGQQAEKICIFIKDDFYPYIIQLTSIGVGFGLVLMYITKIKALSINYGRKENEK